MKYIQNKSLNVMRTIKKFLHGSSTPIYKTVNFLFFSVWWKIKLNKKVSTNKKKRLNN